MKSIGVFCGSSPGFDECYRIQAIETGKLFARKGIKLFYGGGNIGLMGIIADACLESGGEVIGVIPHFLREKEVCHEGLTELVVTGSMHARKKIIAERADAFVVLPGGYGTLDEFFEILTWRQLHLHNKPIGILNVKGFFDFLLKQIDRMYEEGFVKASSLHLFSVADSMEVLLEKMAVPINLSEPKWLKA